MTKKPKEKYTGPRVTDTDTFVKKARWVHGDKYDYSKVEYKGSKKEIEIYCPQHGVFEQTPSNHLLGANCPTCNRVSQTSTKQEFVEKAVDTHGDKYDYSISTYKKANEKLAILCVSCGRTFYQRPNDHLAGQGCPKCSNKNLTNEEWISVFSDRHNNKYIYDRTIFVKSNLKVTITCPSHGSFKQRPNDHMRGKGCPLCAEESRSERWNPNSAYGILGYYGTGSKSNIYVFKLNGSFIKIGLAKDVSRRLYHINYESGYSVEKLYTISGPANDLWNLEQKILRKSNLKRFYPEVSFGGQSECLHLSELPKVLSIIEDWEKNQQSEEKFEESP